MRKLLAGAFAALLVGLGLVWTQPGEAWLMQAPKAAAAAATPAWNPSDKSGYTLSNSNRSATCASCGTTIGARTVANHTTGQYYTEVVATATGASNYNAVGICNASASYSSSVCANNDNNGISLLLKTSSTAVAVNSNATVVCVGPAIPPNFFTVANGDIVGISVDLTTKLAWFRVYDVANYSGWSAWNGSSCNGNPATGTETAGVDISGVTGIGSVAFYVLTGDYNPAGTDENTIPNSYTGTAPSGYSGF